MKSLLILLALLPCFSYAGDCEKLAAFQQNQERKLQGDYMTMYVKREQWIDFLRASDRLLKERYDQRVALCKREVGK